MKTKLLLASFIGTALSANAVTLTTPTGDVGGGVTYAITGDFTPMAQGSVADIRTTNEGGAFNIAFSGGVVDFSFFNTELSQGNNFDGTVGSSAIVTADAGVFSYTAGATFDLTPILSGLGTNELTIGNARELLPSQPGSVSATNGAPFSTTDFGTFSISGVSSIDYVFSDTTNFDGIRAAAVAAAIPEPSSLTLLGLGMAGLVLRRRRA